MTPEEVESRFQSLQTPAPPARLRDRCLTPGRARPQVAFAVAASFLVVALSVWLISSGRPASKAPDRILVAPPPESSGDPVLQDKADRLLQKNPGKAILVVRVKELREGAFHPVTRGFWLKILLEPADEEANPLKEPDGPSANVDLDGTMLFVVSPGKYRGVGYQDSPTEELKKFSYVWEYQDVSVRPGEVAVLSDAVFAPWMQWAGPAEQGEASLKADEKVSWVAYPEVRRVRIGVERITKVPGAVNRETLGFFKGDCPKENAVSLSELLKICRKPFRAGETLAVSLEGYDADGKKLSGCKAQRLFTVTE